MRWAVIALIACGGSSPSWAQDDDEPRAAGADRELGANLGVVTGGRVTPGGVRLGGGYLYQLSAIDWFEARLDVTIGSGKAVCFTDRSGDFLCEAGTLGGRMGELSAGIRRFLRPQDEFTPYAHVRLGARIITLSGDDVRGFGVAAIGGRGVRARVAPLIAVGGGVAIEAGAGWFNRTLGIQPQLALAVYGGVEFLLR